MCEIGLTITALRYSSTGQSPFCYRLTCKSYVKTPESRGFYNSCVYILEKELFLLNEFYNLFEHIWFSDSQFREHFAVYVHLLSSSHVNEAAVLQSQ